MRATIVVRCLVESREHSVRAHCRVARRFIRAHDRRGLALREMLLVIVLLTIAFGLMVSLARGVRSEAAHSLVQRVLLELEDALAAYNRDFAQYPAVHSLVPADHAGPLGPGDESWLRQRAIEQNRALVRALGVGAREDGANSLLGGVSAMMFDGSALLDPWGGAIAFLPVGRSEFGTAAHNAPFFFSGGPDGRLLTRQDNVYSYEVLAAEGREPEQVTGEAGDGPGADSD